MRASFKSTAFLTVEDSRQLAAGNLQFVNPWACGEARQGPRARLAAGLQTFACRPPGGTDAAALLSFVIDTRPVFL
jgi:hypothetical protein